MKIMLSKSLVFAVIVLFIVMSVSIFIMLSGILFACTY